MQPWLGYGHLGLFDSRVTMLSRQLPPDLYDYVAINVSEFNKHDKHKQLDPSDRNCVVRTEDQQMFFPGIEVREFSSLTYTPT
jgi:hypothetical protein